MRLVWAKIVACLAIVLVSTGLAQAQFNILPEIRGGFYARGVDDGASLFAGDRISDANVELLFNAPDLNKWAPLGEFRPHVGATLNLQGKDSYGYAGLSWTFQAPILPVFVEASAGGVIHSTLWSAPEHDTSRAFGCAVGLRAAATAGINLPLGASLMATLEHLPDFGTCGTDRANTNLGVRVGFRF